jgi:hypothetical protein
LRIDTPPTRRFEWKYRVPPELATSLIHAVAAHAEPDAHGENGTYPVRSLYYDTPDLRFYHEKKDGLKIRRKLRVRNYGDDLCFLEIKRKINNKVLKERASLPSAQVAGALDGLDPRVVMSGRPEGDVRTLERFRFNLRSLGLVPTVLISYRRQAFVSRRDPGLRITFDSDLRCRIQTQSETPLEEGDLLPFEERCVLELKFDDRPPRWLLGLSAEFPLKREPFSKYCEGIDRLQVLGGATVAETRGEAARR